MSKYRYIVAFEKFQRVLSIGNPIDVSNFTLGGKSVFSFFFQGQKLIDL